MSITPETSDHTAIKSRITTYQVNNSQPETLCPFVGYPRKNMPQGLPFKLIDYLELVDWTGRILRQDKRGVIAEGVPPILQRLNMQTDNWVYLSEHFESPFKGLVGSVLALKNACQKLGYQRMPGLKSCESYYPSFTIMLSKGLS